MIDTINVDIFVKPPLPPVEFVSMVNRHTPAYNVPISKAQAKVLMHVHHLLIYEAGTNIPLTWTGINAAFPDKKNPTLITKDIDKNGSYNSANDNASGYLSVNVNVPNTYLYTDEGKVVHDGGLVEQTQIRVTENDVIDTTLIDRVTVDIDLGPVVRKDVNFYDYDGTLVDSYSTEQFLQLSTIPENPSHTGLTAQGWNWTLAAAKTYVTKYGKLNIGQTYTTDDGKTRIYISLPEGRISPILMLYLNANSELDIDWGDGSNHSTFTSTSAAYKNERHNYSDAGEYVIAITVVSGSFAIQSQSGSYNTFFTNGDNNNDNSPDRIYLNSIHKIEIGTGIASIGSLAFYNCYSLSFITIPNTVTSIGKSSFYDCYSLSFITIPNTVTSIGAYTFYDCYSLSSITIPNTVTSLGTYAFYECYSLSSITIPNTVTSIGDDVFFGCHSLKSITMPDTVTSIAQSTFSNCQSLSSITIPNTVTSIGSYAFNGCCALSSITLPSTVTSIGSNAFNNCYTLSSITIPNTVTSLGEYTFYNCYTLLSITLSDTVTSIGSYTFYNCYTLSSITIPNTVTSIGNSAFYCCYVLSSITIPNTVTSIGSYAFYNCYSLTSITIPSTITSIGSSTFFGCRSLTSITIPNTVTSIGSYAFYKCSYLDFIRFQPTTPPTVSASNAFNSVPTTTILYAPALVVNLYMNGTNYPQKTTYKYIGYATYTSGETLPSTTSDETYTLTWYATSEDAIAQTNPITVGNGNEIYARAVAI